MPCIPRRADGGHRLQHGTGGNGHLLCSTAERTHSSQLGLELCPLSPQLQELQVSIGLPLCEAFACMVVLCELHCCLANDNLEGLACVVEGLRALIKDLKRCQEHVVQRLLGRVHHLRGGRTPARPRF